MSKEWLATYRLQIHGGFPFAEAESILPYLAELGISHVYLSPCLQSAPGSTHGYDTTDPSRISEEAGGEEGWASFQKAARSYGLGILLDIVPNHMATASSNPWWDELLAQGPYGARAGFFDTFGEGEEERWTLHLPRLGLPAEELLAAGEFRVEMGETGPRLVCGGDSWPIAPQSWPRLFPDLDPSGEISNSLRELAQVKSPDASQLEVWRALTGVLKGKIDPGMQPGELEPEAMRALLSEQFYRLHDWRREREVVNYRRFFAVGSLCGVRVEDPAVFRETHRRMAQMIADGEIDGLRVDHPDGLKDPAGYLQDLRTLFPGGKIYVEKILSGEEALPSQWPVDGTVGYECLRVLNSVMIEPGASVALTAMYGDFTDDDSSFTNLAYAKKKWVAGDLFSRDFARLGALTAEAFPEAGISLQEWIDALVEVTVFLPVYRTYRRGEVVTPADARALREAFALARRGPGMNAEALTLLENLFTGETPGAAGAGCIARWQQLSGAVMAKGVEDTAYYCHTPLAGINEVGGEPARPALSLEEFHAFWHRQSRTWPEGLISSSTHDTKRSEDVRARLTTLYLDPIRWSTVLQEWSSINRPAWGEVPEDRAFEWFFYQTLAGAWPLEEERCLACMEKSCREAGVRTSWGNPNGEYEEAVRRYIHGAYESPEFIASLERFVAELIPGAAIISLARTLIKLTAPGVPDIYQGNELEDLSLVDPDNRRPVDYEMRSSLLRSLTAEAPAPGEWQEPRSKLWLIHRTLRLRRKYAAQFSGAVYLPFYARGDRGGEIIAYLRGEGILVVVPRFPCPEKDWEDTSLVLPDGVWTDHFTGASHSGRVNPGVLLSGFPVSLLIHSSIL